MEHLDSTFCRELYLCPLHEKNSSRELSFTEYFPLMNESQNWEFLRPSEARNDEEGHQGIRTNNAAAEGTCSTRFAKPKCGGVRLLREASVPRSCFQAYQKHVW
jgi:hypothetical protein